MRPDTRAMVYDMTIEDACRQLDLSARAVAALVEEGLLGAMLPQHPRGGPGLVDARFRSDQASTLLHDAPGELARVRAIHPRRTRDYDRALALGALIATLHGRS